MLYIETLQETFSLPSPSTSAKQKWQRVNLKMATSARDSSLMAAMRTEAVDEVAGWRAHRSPEEAHTPPSGGLRGGLAQQDLLGIAHTPEGSAPPEG